VAGAIAGAFLCAGQSCTAAERILVHEAVRDAFVAALAAAAATQVVLGDPFAAQTSMGPLNNAEVAAKTARHVADALARGARLIAGGSAEPGWPTDLYWQATILDDVPRDAVVAREETFGPVAPVIGVASLEDAIALTNELPYGLMASIYTADAGTGLRYADAIRAAWVNVNESSNYWETHLPFGGGGGSLSGVGRVGGRYAMEALTQVRTMVLSGLS
jgi:succinate-semialdehyde dehydrogenase/glutarate-semialdehyde dehydrogenase